MSSAEIEELVAKGLAALDHGHNHLALVCFERAASMEKSPVINSCLAFCNASVRRQFAEAIPLCREALAQEPAATLHYLNLGRVLVLAGQRREAIEIYRQGLQVDRDPRLIEELNRLGARKPRVFQSLRRDHPLNIIFGLVLSKLGMR